MIKSLFFLFLLVPCVTLGQRLSLDRGWLFHRGDIKMPPVKGHAQSYMNAKAGQAPGAAARNYDDSKWRRIHLPHDWAMESPVDSTENLAQGYRKRGIGWYRRLFKLDSSDRGKHIELQFDGVATHCTVWLNGIPVHRNWSGYTSFYIDITAMVYYGSKTNTIAVQVNAENQEGWWYEGAGIYRHTWLVKRSPAHIATNGVYANPIKRTDNKWLLPVEVLLENSGESTSAVDVEVLLKDKWLNTVAGSRTVASVPLLQQKPAHLTLEVRHPKLWSPDTPALYKVVVYVRNKESIIDSASTQCGFRTIQFTADSGFYLNGRRLKIKGTCNHQDMPGVGVAVPDALWEFRIRKLKEMGSNAYRCAHNPPAKEFLDACDRLGILVMNENRNFNSSPEYMRQLRWMVRRDRNHPSIILWSVFNEEPMQGNEIGYQMVRRLTAAVKQLDTTRPVTAAMNGGFFSPVNVAQAIDVAGFNYQHESYDAFHQAHPGLPLISSEDASGLMQREVYITDTAKHLLDAYDTQKPKWGLTHRESWKAIDTRPYLAGCFVWTGFDYHGEPTPYKWPTVNTSFGIMDACGFPKTAYYIRQAQWLDNHPVLAIAPHWNWPDSMIGKPVKVMVISNAEEVELRLNGKLVGKKSVDRYRMSEWQVLYHPGTLEAKSYKKGKLAQRHLVKTTGAAFSIKLIPDRAIIDGDGVDAIPVTVEVVDYAGLVVPTATQKIHFSIEGSAKIIALGNGDANSHEMETGDTRKVFNGLAQVVVQSNQSAMGELILTASSKNLKTAVLKIPVKQKKAPASVPIVKRAHELSDWQLSPLSVNKPDPNVKTEANDMNSWEQVQLPLTRKSLQNGYVILSTVFTPDESQQIDEGEVVFPRVAGKAEVWLDGILTVRKDKTEAQDIQLKLPARAGSRAISLLLQVTAGMSIGPAMPVLVK